MARTDPTYEIFVYGTLRAGGHHHELLSSSTCLGVARTAPLYRLVCMGRYPAMARGGETSVLGEIYRVDPPTLRRLDQLEGHPGLYKRDSIQLDDGRPVLTYLMSIEATTGREPITDGDWLKFRDR